ncbi:2813_t:CDS:2, partial [Funneliformis caledonium]
NAYERLFTQLFEIIENLNKISVKFYHIDSINWKCILGDLDARNLMAKDFNNEVYTLAASISSKSNVEEVYKCFKKLKTLMINEL